MYLKTPVFSEKSNFKRLFLVFKAKKGLPDQKNRSALGIFSIAALLAGCTPTVKVEAPDKPIVINMNMKIDRKVRVKLQNDLKKAKKDHPDVFA